MSSEILFIHESVLRGNVFVRKCGSKTVIIYVFLQKLADLFHNFGDNYILMADYLLVILFSISTI
jgi:hypothetical protein